MHTAEQSTTADAPGTEIMVSLAMPPQVFHCDEDARDDMEWNGTYRTAIFPVTCPKHAACPEPRRYAAKAIISIAGQEPKDLHFELKVAVADAYLP